jgi:type IV secretion system protein VirD4
MKDLDIKKLIIKILPFVIFFYLADKVGQAFRLADGADMSAKILNLSSGFSAAFGNPLPSFHPMDLLVGAIGAGIIALMLQQKKANAKKYRKGTEYGSARFGTPADIKPFIDPDPENNVILTQTEKLTMNSRPPNPAHARNKNVLVIGGSGSGKTRFFVKPNLMQCMSKPYPVSFCCTDQKGTILLECGQLLQRAGYEIKIMNTINFGKSMKYNPFAYIRDEKDILKLVSAIIANTKGDGEKSNEDFWVKAERLFYTALIGYIFYEGREDEKNFITFLDMLNASDAREDDEDYKTRWI